MTYSTSTKNICTSCTWFVNIHMPPSGVAFYFYQPLYEGMQYDLTLAMDSEADI